MNTRGFAELVFAALAALLVSGLFFETPAFAQAAPERAQAQAEREQTQPGNNSPFWFDAQAGRVGSTQVESIEAGSIINPGGQVWRALHEGQLRWWAGIWLIAIPVLILLFYFIVGPMRLHEAPTGREIRRFAAWERTVHWTAAITFLILAVTGLTLYFGKYYLALLLSYPIYSWVARIFVSAHNFTAPIFVASLILSFLNFLSRNLWRGYDWTWVKRGGGLVSKRDPGSGFFNAGEKLWFWGGVVILGLVMTCSGFLLLFPVYNQTRNVLAVADITHLIGALLFIGAGFGHIYMGTIGLPGAYRAMRRGLVDQAWAKEHHRLWYEDLREGRAHEAAEGGFRAQTSRTRSSAERARTA
ncbi:MAG TPA: formate dehydrogenase subunit gamma [Burkholderiales bacterium]|nr:formate dehydrogenase subunit gamma [Burkholderiales bacterium]